MAQAMESWGKRSCSERPVGDRRVGQCCILIHIGRQQAGPRLAAILSVIESCRRIKVPVRDYLGDILPGLANTSIQRLAELTPTA